MTDAQKAGKILSEEQLAFIQNELEYEPATVSALSDDDFAKLYDRLCEIEVEETLAAEDEARELSDRGKMAEGIVTALGNALYSSESEE